LDNTTPFQNNSDAVQNSTTDQHINKRKSSKILRTLFVSLEIALVVGLLVLWFVSPGIRQSKSLWVLFFYSFPSQFLIAIVPHEPVFLYFSKFYSPLQVTSVAIAGVLLTEILNYNVFGFFTGFKASRRIFDNKIVARLVTLFKKYPFLALWIGGFTPVPFYPMRFLVVLAHYPMWKYLLAVALSRTPRFFILAWLGYALKISNSLLIIIFIVILVALYVPVIKEAVQQKKEKMDDAVDGEIRTKKEGE
jgi:membrane protein YqaA with SNARE-associated domain